MLVHSKRDILKNAAIITLEHHEKWNGSGYPRGLKGKEIHLYGRIVAVADVFDALSTVRSYKEAWNMENILIVIKSEKGEHFVPELVDIFLENLPEFEKIKQMYGTS